MFRRRISIVFFLCAVLLSSGCQDEVISSPPIEAATETPVPPATATSTPLTDESTISVPPGQPQAIDGIISPGEWDDAQVEIFAGGSEILLMQSDGYLYLAIRANTEEMIVGNVFVGFGNEIKILHTSAALGTGIYQKEADRWQLIQEFEWCCRSFIDSETAQAERDEFLQSGGWVATNSRIGTPNEAEYQIEIPGETFHVAVNYILASETNVKIPWPDGLDDDCIKPTPGGLPEQLHFSPDKWITLEIQESDG